MPSRRRRPCPDARCSGRLFDGEQCTEIRKDLSKCDNCSEPICENHTYPVHVDDVTSIAMFFDNKWESQRLICPKCCDGSITGATIAFGFETLWERSGTGSMDPMNQWKLEKIPDMQDREWFGKLVGDLLPDVNRVSRDVRRKASQLFRALCNTRKSVYKPWLDQ
jgi:hypothetical protein